MIFEFPHQNSECYQWYHQKIQFGLGEFLLAGRRLKRNHELLILLSMLPRFPFITDVDQFLNQVLRTDILINLKINKTL